MKRAETETNHERAGNRDRRSEARSALDERAKTKRNKQHLQAAVGRNPRNRFLHDFKLAGFDGNVVQVDGGENDPCDF